MVWFSVVPELIVVYTKMIPRPWMPVVHIQVALSKPARPYPWARDNLYIGAPFPITIIFL